ncbi:hypothetical protein I8748_17735 [Nostoc sp. CENA67]|uniref:non-specific serine/threonine protein kinase n=1 Tax=Amazonocrinis nigriterrae CENA67 TaxID=2794033 RepID=A0A8J7HUU3_9NOST|nr:hypothetical protein [Amazonocrinis nigriterrae CENA67]
MLLLQFTKFGVYSIEKRCKPSNIIRRRSDCKLVLIDFGAVKEVSTPQLDDSEPTPFTIGIGTKGYAPSEQCFGRPQYNSDIYAVGMIAIKALTGIPPHELDRDIYGEVKWSHKAVVSNSLAQILSQMVLDNCKQRYQSALQILADIDQLINSPNTNVISKANSPIDTLSKDDLETPTTPWTGSFSETSVLDDFNQSRGDGGMGR